MKTRNGISRMMSLFLWVLLMACSAEDGAVGPAGPQGPQGEQGIPGTDGQDGQDGADGQDGTANVFSSGWFEIDPWDTDIPDFKFHRIPGLILSEFQIENNLILIYRRYQPIPTFTSVTLLPLAEYNSSGTLELLLTSRVQGNGLFIQIESYGRNVTNDEYLGPETQFRYIIIEPDPTSDKRPINFSKMQYDEVIKYLGLDL